MKIGSRKQLIERITERLNEATIEQLRSIYFLITHMLKG